MALIECPECGHKISNKAIRCPQCGYPLQKMIKKEEHKTETENEVNKVQKKTEHRLDNGAEKTECANISQNITKTKKKAVAVVGVLVLIGVIGTIAYFISARSSAGFNIRVENVEISKWKMTEDGSYSDSYQATISSDEKKPFVAVIGDYENNDNRPNLVFLENGEGMFETSVSDDEDPSLKYRAIGYLSGKIIDDEDIKDITQSDSAYYDYDDKTNCFVDVDIELMDKNIDGILIYDLTNDLNNNIVRNNQIAVVGGKASSSELITDLPYKSRGVKISIHPKMLCQSKDVVQGDYECIKEYSAEKEEYGSSTSYAGSAVYEFKNISEGFVIYTQKLTEGGIKENRNVIKYNSNYIHKSETEMSTYDSDRYVNTTLLEPVYEFNVEGIIEWNSLTTTNANDEEGDGKKA